MQREQVRAVSAVRTMVIGAAVAAVGGSLATTTLAAGDFSLLGQYTAKAGGAEIVSYDPINKLLLSTYSDAPTFAHGVEVINFANPAAPAQARAINLGGIFTSSISSVAADPLGRNIGVATGIPTDNAGTTGKLAFFNTATGAVLKTLDVGFHPDSVTFSPDGSKLFVVNEGEFVAGTTEQQAPGSLSVVDLAGVTGPSSITANAFSNAKVTTRDFTAPNLGAANLLDGVRVNRADTPQNKYLDIEPEYATFSPADNKLYVSLQENNALAVYDLATHKWTNVHKLGTITQTIDASDRDGAGGSNAIGINDVVPGLPMPDAIASYRVGGKTYVISANEGDARPDDADTTRVSAYVAGKTLDPVFEAQLVAAYGSVANATWSTNPVTGLGRLTISNLASDNDPDGDGDIDRFTMLGSRSLSIWDPETGARVGDTGSLFETYTRDFDASGWADGRSDDKGPEPEALTFGSIGDKTYAFAGMERTNGIFMLDISDPANPTFVDYLRTAGDVSPEGMTFIPASMSPNGQNLLVVGYEVSSTISVFTVVPEPASLGLLASGALGLLRRRRA